MQPSRITINVKLISIISAIVILTALTLIVIATYFFKSDNERRIYLNNHRLAELVALKVQSDFRGIESQCSIMAGSGQGAASGRLANSLFLYPRSDFFYLGVSPGVGGQGSFSACNESFLAENNISRNTIKGLLARYEKIFSSSVPGHSRVCNVSSDLKIPAIGISLCVPLPGHGGGFARCVMLMTLNRFLEAFDTQDANETFMVNGEGDLLAHSSDQNLVYGANYSGHPIVRMMKKSVTDNGETKFRDERGGNHLASFKKIGFADVGIITSVSEEAAYQEVYRMQRRNMYIAGIILTIAVVMIYLFGKTISTPIRALVEAVGRIEQGKFRVDISPSTRDEIGVLTCSVAAMGRGLEERELIKDAFGKFVNKDVAESVMKGSLSLGGVRTTAAVFFSDIRSFTAISEKLEPEEVVEFLNEYLTAMVSCVNETSGVVDKFIGDAIMAVWGAPVSTGHDAENAINAALMMRFRLMEFNRGRSRVNGHPVRIGCGINYGPVLAGQIGSEERMEYTVIGDTVNLASRIEALNKPFGTDILISEDTWKEVQGVFHALPMRRIRVKGKESPLQIYAVLGRRDDAECPRTIEELCRLTGTDFPGSPVASTVAAEELKYEIIAE